MPPENQTNMINFVGANFNRYIIHTIHKKEREEKHSSVSYKDHLLDVDLDSERIIKTRLSDACGKQTKSFSVAIADSSEGSFFSLAKAAFDKGVSDTDFIEISKDIALLLATAQTTRNPSEGILLVAEGETTKGMKFLIALKAELQQAFKTSINPKTNKEQLQLLKDLFMSPDKKLFKIGMIKQDINKGKTYPNSDFSSLLFDDQFARDKNPAAFFYSDFLGFTLDKNEKLATRDFYRMTEGLINKYGGTYKEKQIYLSALRALLWADNSPLIDPKEFGKRYFNGKLLEKYYDMISNNPSFSRSFTKNIILLNSELSTRKWKFDGVEIKGKEDKFDEAVKIIENQEQAHQALENPATTLVELKGKPGHGDDK